MYDPTGSDYFRTSPPKSERGYTEPISQDTPYYNSLTSSESTPSLEYGHVRIKLVWKKEKQTLEREVVYFDHTGISVIMKWSALYCYFDGRCSLATGEHFGTLAIVDCEESVNEVMPFIVESQPTTSITENIIILKLKCDSADKYYVNETPLQKSLSLMSTPEICQSSTSFHDTPYVSKNMTTDDQSDIVFKLEQEVVTLKNRVKSADEYCNVVEREKQQLIAETTQLKGDKQKLKKESYELDNQLIDTLVKLSSKEKLDALTEERYQALLKEAKTLEEANFKLNDTIFRQNGELQYNTTTIREMELDLKKQNQIMCVVVDEKDELTSKYSKLMESNENNEKIEEDMNRYRSDIALLRESNKTHESSTYILKKQYSALRESVIPNLERDIQNMREEKAESELLYQREIDNMNEHNKCLVDRVKTLQKFFASSNTIKRVDEGDELDLSKEPITIIDTLTKDFESCSKNLKVLTELLGDSLKSKDLQLERKQMELRSAGERNASLIKEVANLGKEVTQLSNKLDQKIEEKELLFESIRDFKLEKINLTSLIAILPEENAQQNFVAIERVDIKGFKSQLQEEELARTNKYTFDM